MPTYCWRCEDCDELTTVIRTLSRRNQAPACEGCGSEQMARDMVAEQGGANSHRPDCWPMLSDAAGVHPSQIGEMTEYLAKKGVRAEFHKDGRMKFNSQKHRKRCCEALGYFDRSGGYGDPQKK